MIARCGGDHARRRAHSEHRGPCASPCRSLQIATLDSHEPPIWRGTIMHANRTRRLITVLTSVVMLATLAGPASAAIRIDRIRYDAPGSDTGTNAHLNEERVVLINTGDSARDIGGRAVSRPPRPP